MEKKGKFSDFPLTFWIVIIFEFFERGAYYGVMSFLSVYMANDLGFAKESVGTIKGTIQPLLYFLPILTGAIADRLGYRKMLLVAFSLLGLGYFLTSQNTEYFPVFASLIIMAFGAGTFKPIISGTIAKLTDESNSGLGFGIFYWSINLGALVFPLIFVPWLKSIDPSYVLVLASICTAAMIIPTLLVFREPKREEQVVKESFRKAIEGIFKKIILVFIDWRFILFIFIYSWFWILYFQMFDSVLWYVAEFVDATPLNNFINGIFGTNWKFDVEHVTVINALTIILLQLFVSAIVRKTKPMPTIIAGISMGTIGMAILSLSTGIWVFMTGIIIFSIGEMTAHPKYISYLGLIAPPDKKATYMGFGFLYGVFGGLIGSILGAKLYVMFIDNPMISFISGKLGAAGSAHLLKEGAKLPDALKAAETIGITKAEAANYANPSELWLIFACIGIACIAGLLLYQKLIGTREK